MYIYIYIYIYISPRMQGNATQKVHARHHISAPQALRAQAPTNQCRQSKHRVHSSTPGAVQLLRCHCQSVSGCEWPRCRPGSPPSIMQLPRLASAGGRNQGSCTICKISLLSHAVDSAIKCILSLSLFLSLYLSFFLSTLYIVPSQNRIQLWCTIGNF